MKLVIGMGATLAIGAIFCSPHSQAADPVATPRIVQNYGKLPLSFEANNGQMDGRVRFRSRGSKYSLFLTQDGVVLALRGVKKPQDLYTRNRVASQQAAETKSVIRMCLIGNKAGVAVTGTDQLPGTSNYLIGSDPKKWRTNVPTYGKVKYSEVYPGVDLLYYGNQGGELEYDFVVAPGADPTAIRFALSGAEGRFQGQSKGRKIKFKIDSKGDLVTKTGYGEVRFHEPLVYQTRGNEGQREAVVGHYVLRAGGQIGFEIGSYDYSKPLFIDPVLSYATYLGGSVQDGGAAIAVDALGNAYVTGMTLSADFPTVNPIQATCNGGTGCANSGDVFVTKVNADGSALVYSTFLGGSGEDAGQGIAVDSSGNVYVAGWTESTDFPTMNAIQTTNAALTGETGFVAKLNADGSALLYSTYLGGTFQTACFGVAVDSSGSAYVTGTTSGAGFPITPGAFQTAGAAFVAKLTSDGSTLAYSTLIGGATGVDQGRSIAVDSSGNAYITGITQSDGQSADFPTVNPIQASNNSCDNGACGTAFVSKLSSDGSSLIFSTYLGGSSSDTGQGITVDSSGNAYVTGGTTSTDFPTVNPFQATCESCSPSSPNAFVAKLNAAGSALVYSTYLGGDEGSGGNAIAVDSSGNAYVTGTASDGFPIANALQDTCRPVNGCLYGGGVGNAFVAEFNATGSALVYSTYLGGGLTYGNGIAVDSNGNVYLTGQTRGNLPVVNAFQPLPKDSGYGTAFVAKINPANLPGVSVLPAGLSFDAQPVGTSSATQTVTLLDVGSAPLSISSIVTSGDFSQTNNCGNGIPVSSSCAITVTFTPIATVSGQVQSLLLITATERPRKPSPFRGPDWPM